jgi:DNA repair photolyase
MAVTCSNPVTPLKRGSLSDYFTNSLYSCASYRGCGHGCRYCDGRAEKYYVEGDFEKDLEVRRGLPEALAAALAKERERSLDGRRCLVSVGSGVTDVYQPLERKEQLTRRCAAVFASDAGTAGIPDLQVPPYPVLLLTKSSLILRDIDLWKKVHSRTGFILLLSITPLEESLRKELEPSAPPMEERRRTAEEFCKAGIPVGILAMPLLPGLSDSGEALHSLYAWAAETGVAFVMPGGLTLRPGRQKSLYLETLARLNRPELLQKYEVMYRENRASGAPTRKATGALHDSISSIIRETGMPFLLPHRIYRTMVPDYEALHILFSHMRELYRFRGIETAPLVRASDRYGAWLKEQRTTLRRRRSLAGDWIDLAFRELLRTNALEELLDNCKLAAFTREITEGGVFDYSALKILQ